MRLLLPDSDGYEAARRPAIDRYAALAPAEIALCGSPEDVAEALAHARGRALAVRSGGHCFAGRSSTRGVLIDVSPLDSVAVADGTATIGAGARLGAIYDALDAHAATIPAGCGPDVGIAGLTLGGGLGILGRAHGLTCDSLLAAQVVLADGRVVDCDGERESELFWALRGAGGGRFGIVTALTFRTLPAPVASCFDLRFPDAEIERLIAAWQAWSPDAPDALAASLLVSAPADPALPPAARVFGAMAAGAAHTRIELGRLGLDPAAATLTTLPYRAAKAHLAGPGDDDPTARAEHRSEFFRRSLAPEAIAALVGALRAERVAGAWRELDFSPWGGAYNRVSVDATAFAHRSERFLLKHAAEGDRAWLARSYDAVHAYGAGGIYPNFPEPGRDPWDPAYHGPNRDRLLRAAAAYDPDDVLSAAPRPSLAGNR